MVPITRFRSLSGAALCAIAILTLLAGCGKRYSVLAQVDGRVTPDLAAREAAPTVTLNAGAPALSLFNKDFHYTYPAGSYTEDPRTWVELDVAAGPVTVNWFARTRGGARVWAYRWALDIADLFDQTPRVNEATDPAHWSGPSLSSVSATVGPFAAGEQHLLYVEVTDSNGIKSLRTVHMRVAGP